MQRICIHGHSFEHVARDSVESHSPHTSLETNLDMLAPYHAHRISSVKFPRQAASQTAVALLGVVWVRGTLNLETPPPHGELFIRDLSWRRGWPRRGVALLPELWRTAVDCWPGKMEGMPTASLMRGAWRPAGQMELVLYCGEKEEGRGLGKETGRQIMSEWKRKRECACVGGGVGKRKGERANEWAWEREEIDRIKERKKIYGTQCPFYMLHGTRSEPGKQYYLFSICIWYYYELGNNQTLLETPLDKESSFGNIVIEIYLVNSEPT